MVDNIKRDAYDTFVCALHSGQMENKKKGDIVDKDVSGVAGL